MKPIGYTRALHSYTTDLTSECEISFSKGALIVVFANLDSGWSVGSVVGSKVAGFFPKNYCLEIVESISDVPNPFDLGSSMDGYSTHSHPSLNTFVNNTNNDESENVISQLTSEIALLRKQLELQKEITKTEIEKRKKFEQSTMEYFDKFAILLSQQSHNK